MPISTQKGISEIGDALRMFFCSLRFHPDLKGIGVGLEALVATRGKHTHHGCQFADRSEVSMINAKRSFL
jgi:hypothetical protein